MQRKRAFLATPAHPRQARAPNNVNPHQRRKQSQVLALPPLILMGSRLRKRNEKRRAFRRTEKASIHYKPQKHTIIGRYIKVNTSYQHRRKNDCSPITARYMGIHALMMRDSRPQSAAPAPPAAEAQHINTAGKLGENARQFPANSSPSPKQFATTRRNGSTKGAVLFYLLF